MVVFDMLEPINLIDFRLNTVDGVIWVSRIRSVTHCLLAKLSY